jgi:HPt (histidine-containing phosphotransfer) domain-containing protein
MPNLYSHIDLGYLESITDGSYDLIKELISIFIEQIPEFKEGFDEGLKSKNWGKIAAVAHKAKSSVMSMGMEDLGNKDLKNLELIAKLLKMDDIEEDSDETIQIQRNFDSYSDERKQWLLANKNEDKIKELIIHFNKTCESALAELKEVLKD